MAETNPYNNENLTGANPAQMTPSSPIINTDNKGITGSVGAPTTTAIFDVNKFTAAAQQFAAMNAIANQMFGYDFKWFRAVPQKRSMDVIFQEYTLYNVDECPWDIKAVVPNGQFPDSKYNYDLMGLEYEVPLEIQIDKKYWESVVGFGTAPQKKDIVYMPLANKLYQVESTYLYRGFMEQETTWKINLRKYMPEAARRELPDLRSTIDIYTVSSEEIFGTTVDSNVGKLIDDTQMNQFNGTSQDKYKSVDSKLETISKDLNIYGTTFAQSYYDMSKPIWYDAITYNAGDLLNKSSDRCITAWINPQVSLNKQYNVTSITAIIDPLDPLDLSQWDASLYSKANYDITVNLTSILNEIKIDDNIVVSRPGALNFYAKVVAISVNPLIFHCMINSFVLEDLEEIKSDWATQKGYKLQIKEPISIIDGVNDYGEHVLSVNVYANQYIAISYDHTYAGDDAYVIRMDEKLNDNEWYGIVVNIGNSWQQYNVYVWKKHDTDKNAKLQIFFYETLRLYPKDIVVEHYTVNKSPAFLTNLRLFKCSTLEEEKQANELLSYFSRDGDQLLIGDNADPLMLLPYITKQR